MSDSSWVHLTSYSLPYMAEMLQSALVANGIQAKVFNANTARILAHMSQAITADVMVQSKDLLAAKQLLVEFESAATAIEE